MGLDGRQQLPPHRGLDPVGRDQEIGGDFAAIIEMRDGAPSVLRDRDQRAAVMVDIVGWQAQAPPDAILRRHHLPMRFLADHIAVPREHDAAFERDADLVARPGRESERFVQLVVGRNARAARSEFLAGALVDRYVPADLTKQ